MRRIAGLFARRAEQRHERAVEIDRIARLAAESEQAAAHVILPRRDVRLRRAGPSAATFQMSNLSYSTHGLVVFRPAAVPNIGRCGDVLSDSTSTNDVFTLP